MKEYDQKLSAWDFTAIQEKMVENPRGNVKKTRKQ